MLLSIILAVLLGIFALKTCAADLQKLCEGQRYGTLVPNPKDCNSFYVCQFVVQLTHCDPGLHFDRRNKVCNWPQFAGCDWVEAEAGDSVENLSVEKPEKPTENQDKSPETVEVPSSQFSVEEALPTGGGSLSEEEQKSESGDETQLSGENGLSRPTEKQPSEEIGNISKNSEEVKPDFTVTENNVITEKPHEPLVDPSHSSGESPDSQQNLSSTTDHIIDDKPHTPNLSSEDNQENQHPSTEDDLIIVSKEDPSTPGENSSESIEATPGFPKPNHPPIIEESPSQKIENSSETVNTNEGSIKPPHVDNPDPGITTYPPTASQLWNLIASIVSVKSSQTSGFINQPAVGAHNPETGYPVHAMTGYDPNNIQCLHNGLYFLPHPSNCQKYFICAYRHLHLHSCGNGVIWNHKREQCDLKGYARCYSREVEPDVSIELITPPSEEETTSVTQTSTRIPISKSTKLPQTTAGNRLPICPKSRQVYLPNLDDCHRYFICIMGKPVLTSCPSGMHWDAIGEFCGKPSVVRCARR